MPRDDVDRTVTRKRVWLASAVGCVVGGLLVAACWWATTDDVETTSAFPFAVSVAPDSTGVGALLNWSDVEPDDQLEISVQQGTFKVIVSFATEVPELEWTAMSDPSAGVAVETTPRPADTAGMSTVEIAITPDECTEPSNTPLAVSVSKAADRPLAVGFINIAIQCGVGG